MPPDNAGHVFHAAVADLDTSPVEDLVEFVRFREVPVEAEVEADNLDPKVYIGLTEHSFKSRYSGHT